MTPNDARNVLQYVIDTIGKLADANPGEWDTDDALTVWDQLDNLLALVKIVTYQHGALLAARLPAEYEHPVIGTVHWDTESKQRWDGAGVLSALSAPLMDRETGEILDAVPTATLRNVLPAVQPGKTSSKWNKTGLTAAGIQPSAYCDTEWGSKVLKRGPKYRRNLTAPPEGAPAPSSDP